MRSPSAVVEDSAVDRERLIGVLRIAQAAGDIVHAKALRLIVKGFDERVRAERRRHRVVPAQAGPKPHRPGKGTPCKRVIPARSRPTSSRSLASALGWGRSRSA